MAENSKIEWTDHTVNIWWGCAKVHTGCKNCYAETLSKRFGKDIWGERANRQFIKSSFPLLEKLNKKAGEKGVKEKVFIGSMMDIFEDNRFLDNYNPQYFRNAEISNPTIDRVRYYLFQKINELDNLIFLLLTKRPQNIRKMIPTSWERKGGIPKNVLFGISASNQETFNESVLWVSRLYNSIGAKVFLSVEPQVGEIDFTKSPSLYNVEWIIQGGESGSKKRPFDIDWAYLMMNQCRFSGIPYFFKQIDKVQEIPEDLKVRQFPDF